jgi:hypothetical protein
MCGKGAFMSRKRTIDDRDCIRMSIGRPPVRTTLLLRRFFSAIGNCFGPMRRLAADLAFVPFACCTRPAACAVIIISIQARGERRAPRFDY